MRNTAVRDFMHHNRKYKNRNTEKNGDHIKRTFFSRARENRTPAKGTPCPRTTSILWPGSYLTLTKPLRTRYLGSLDDLRLQSEQRLMRDQSPKRNHCTLGCLLRLVVGL